MAFDLQTHTWLRSPALASQDRVVHRFFTRRGGVSNGVYATLNTGLGSADAPARVLQNRAFCAGVMGVSAANLMTPWQMHGNSVITFRSRVEWQVAAGSGRAPKGDAVVTDCPGVAIGVCTADCGPILLADSAAGVIGVAHAGWRGAAQGILTRTIEAMEALGARRSHILGALGPTISQDAYEVGEEVRQAMSAFDRGCERVFRPAPRAGHFRFSLATVLQREAESLNLAAFEVLDRCTYGEAAEFFSYRRVWHEAQAASSDAHPINPDYGRMISSICLPAT